MMFEKPSHCRTCQLPKNDLIFSLFQHSHLHDAQLHNSLFTNLGMYFVVLHTLNGSSHRSINKVQYFFSCAFHVNVKCIIHDAQCKRNVIMSFKCVIHVIQFEKQHCKMCQRLCMQRTKKGEVFLFFLDLLT